VSGPYDSDLADPESFVMAGAFFQAADSVGVVDIGLPRVKIIGPELTVRREVTLPGIVRAVHVVDWPTNVIVVGALRGPDSVGWPLHRLDLSGKRARVLQSFGDNGGELRLGQSSLVNDRRISVAHSGDLWAAEVLAYRLHLFAESGSARRSLAHDRDWFTSTGVRHSTSPPGEYIDGIAVDELEQVWVFARVRSPNWQNADGTRKDDQADVWHSRIEVLDSEGSGVLASTEVDGLVLYVAGNDILAMYERDNATGRHLVHLVRFALTPSS